MKKIILTIVSLFLLNSLAFAVDQESENPIDTERSETVTVENTAGTLSKSESFMVAFGMHDSSVVGGGESGGNPAPAAATAVASTNAHSGAVVLTSSQNTPYSYK